MPNDRLNRFLGGSPLRILIQLVLLSFLVGVVLAALDLTPYGIVDWIVGLVRHILDMGFGAVERIGSYLVLGAVVVVPIWLILRLLNAGKG